MPKEEDDLQKILEALDAELAKALNPPPHFGELSASAAAAPAGVDEDSIRRGRRELEARLVQDETVGSLLRGRRIGLGFDLEEFARNVRWGPDDLEALEVDRMDLHQIDPEALGILLYGLGMKRVGVLEEPLRKLALQHLAVHQSAGGPVYGRSRRGVTSFERRRGLMDSAVPVDVDATMRAAEAYLRQVESKLGELGRR